MRSRLTTCSQRDDYLSDFLWSTRKMMRDKKIVFGSECGAGCNMYERIHRLESLQFGTFHLGKAASERRLKFSTPWCI